MDAIAEDYRSKMPVERWLSAIQGTQHLIISHIIIKHCVPLYLLGEIILKCWVTLFRFAQ